MEMVQNVLEKMYEIDVKWSVGGNYFQIGTESSHENIFWITSEKNCMQKIKTSDPRFEEWG